MKRDSISLIIRVALVGLILGIIGNGVLYSKGVSPFNLIHIDQTYLADDRNIQSLEVSSPSDTIVVNQSNDSQFHFRIVGTMSYSTKPKEPGHLITTEQDTLKFSLLENKKLQVGIVNNSLRLEVAVPKKSLKRISIKSNSGDITIGDIEGSVIQLENNSGNIKAENVAGNLKLINHSGDTHLIMNKVENDLSFINTSGNFKLTLGQAPAALETKLQTKSGEIKQKLSTMLFRESSDSEKQQNGIIGLGKPKVEGRTTTGDITIMLAK